MTGAIDFTLTDLLDEGIAAEVEVRFVPQVSGFVYEVEWPMDGERHLRVDGIGTGLYQCSIAMQGYRPYRYFQRIREGENRPADNQIWLMTDPKKVRGISAPAFSDLPLLLQGVLDEAVMNLKGDALYQSLGPQRTASLLNIFLKASHRGTTDNCFQWVEALQVVQEDRIYASVSAQMEEFLEDSERFASADMSLHDPLPGYQLRQSFKSRDSHANLQVTLMQKGATGAWAADIDIDESSGFGHGMEVIRNAVTGKRTNPYLIRELLILQDLSDRTFDPLYRLIL